MCLMSVNCHSFKTFLNLGKRIKSRGDISKEYGECISSVEPETALQAYQIQILICDINSMNSEKLITKLPTFRNRRNHAAAEYYGM